MKAKRSLGQNFFINKNLGDYIVNILKQENCDSIIEIGPGLGFFTERLVKEFKKVTAIEKDTELSKQLVLQYPTVNVVNMDFLDINISDITKQDSIFFGSLPYNIAKQIVRKIVESKNFTKPSFFILQKEVAEKYLYKEPFSTLSLTTAIYAQCKKILDISPDSFNPRPRVNSSLISFKPIERDINDTHLLESLIKLSFRQPRKNMRNNLKGTQFEKGLNRFENHRPGQLSLDEYIEICKYSL